MTFKNISHTIAVLINYCLYCKTKYLEQTFLAGIFIGFSLGTNMAGNHNLEYETCSLN